MITYEEALKKAKELKPTIDNCTEYENGFVFACKDDDNYEGGNHTPCVILKESGKAIPMPVFVMQGTGEELKSFDI